MDRATGTIMGQNKVYFQSTKKNKLSVGYNQSSHAQSLNRASQGSSPKTDEENMQTVVFSSPWPMMTSQMPVRCKLH
jgi:hypothetical protein